MNAKTPYELACVHAAKRSNFKQCKGFSLSLSPSPMVNGQFCHGNSSFGTLRKRVDTYIHRNRNTPSGISILDNSRHAENFARQCIYVYINVYTYSVSRYPNTLYTGRRYMKRWPSTRSTIILTKLTTSFTI